MVTLMPYQDYWQEILACLVKISLNVCSIMFSLSMYTLILVVNFYLLFYCKYNCVFVYVYELHIFVVLSPSLFKKDKIPGLISILVHHRHSCDGCASLVGSCKVRCRCWRMKRNIFFLLRNSNSRKKENKKELARMETD